MNSEQQKVVNDLIEKGQMLLQSSQNGLGSELEGFPEAQEILNDIVNYPHHFVLGCVMDRQIRAERAWIIPYKIGKAIGGFDFKSLFALTLGDLKEIFAENTLHRFNDVMADSFHSAVQDIHNKYNGDASNIWINKPKSAAVIRRFLEFKGVGIKIANMAVNILVRSFKVPMHDYSSIDIAPDVQVKKFFTYHKLLRVDASTEELVYLARELYPDFPGLLDIAAWEGGRLLK